MTNKKKITKLTPMLQQYMEIKEQHADTILFYRLGDFYEMFFDDAIEAAQILNITLTSRNKKTDEVQIPMCGIPYHAVQGYLPKLIKAGKRVAICEQVEDPAEAKGIVKREVVRIVSPGVITDDALLDDKNNNYVCAVTLKDKLFGVSFLDISTGEFLVAEYRNENQEIAPELLDQVSRFAPTEILLAEREQHHLLEESLTALLPEICVTPYEVEYFQLDQATETLLEHFNILNFEGFGCGALTQGIAAAGALLQYAAETQKASINHIEKLTPIETDAILHLDESSRRNLELVQTIAGGSRQGSLLAVLDQTVTPMGARLLRHDLLFPLQNKTRIDDRLDALTWFFNNAPARQRLRKLLSKGYDLERLNSRMIVGSGNARDMLAIRNSLAVLPDVLDVLTPCDSKKLIAIRKEFDPLTDLHDLLENAIDPEAPITLREGRLIRQGYNPELDELTSLLRDGKQQILKIESKERQTSGIAKLKVGFNKVFGYYIEVSKIHSASVPAHYIRKQTLVNAERFITEELKEFETAVLGAQERSIELEYQLFLQIRQTLTKNSSRILKTANLLAQLDVFLCHAETAHRHNYHRPIINNGQAIHITEGRHPVIEQMLPSGKFVPNDVFLDQKNDEVHIITGPNMAGKSTILRQTALIVLMAQMGSYVPAAKTQIGIVDRIFTRVGAMDNLRQGQSTFMVEMSETANILNNATEKSLIILDEIGRGTSTYDGLAIAWAVAEDLVKKNGIGVKTLFATHYHELTELAHTHQRVQNYSIGVREWQGKIIFLHKLMKGGTSRSYGIQVAALAGVPSSVVARAEEILDAIEKGEFSAISHQPGRTEIKEKKRPAPLSLFSTPQDPIIERLKEINLDNHSPMEALQLLYELKEKLENKKSK